MPTHGTLPIRASQVRGLSYENSVLTAVYDLIANHILASCGSFIFVDPIRLEPLVLRNEAELDRRIGQRLHASV